MIRVAPLPSLLPAPAAPPNITRWGLHGRTPDRSNVRRGRRGKAGKPENPNPHTRVKVRMRKAPRRNFGMKLESRRLSSTKIPGSADWPRRIAVVGSLLDPSHHRVCGIWHRSACLAMWFIGGGAFVQHKRMRQAAMILGGCRPGLRTWYRYAAPGIADRHRWLRGFGIAVVCCVSSTAQRCNRRVLGDSWLLSCTSSVEHHVARLSNAALVRDDFWPALIGSAR